MRSHQPNKSRCWGQLRRARYGHLLGLHILMQCAAVWSPTEISGALFCIDRTSPARKFTRIYVVVNNYGIHKAKAVVLWRAHHPRFELVWSPFYSPRTNPIERAFGDVQNKCTRNHKRTSLPDLIADVRRHLRWNRPWRYPLSDLYYAPEVEAALAEIKNTQKLEAALVFQSH